MIGVLALLVLFIVLLVRGVSGGSPAGPSQGRPHRSAIDILEERFAKGEINRDEFEERRRILEN